MARICRSHLTISADKAGVQFPASEIFFCSEGSLCFFVFSMSAPLLEMEGKPGCLDGRRWMQGDQRFGLLIAARTAYSQTEAGAIILPNELTDLITIIPSN